MGTYRYFLSILVASGFFFHLQGFVPQRSLMEERWSYNILPTLTPKLTPPVRFISTTLLITTPSSSSPRGSTTTTTTTTTTRLYNRLWNRLQVEEDEEPFWYLINCVAGLEMDLLRQCRLACKDMPDAYKFVVPTEIKTRSHGANRMVTETKVKYQGYVFAKLRLCPEVYEAIQGLDLCRSWMGTVNHIGHKKLPPAPVALNELEVENFGLEDLEYEDPEEDQNEEDGVIVDEAGADKKNHVDEEAIKVYLGIKVDDMVKVTKSCKFFNEDGIVRRLKDGKIFVRFYTYGSMFEEWMDPEDVRKLTDTEVLKGLSGPQQPVTQRDFEETTDGYDSDGSRKAGSFRRDLISNMKGGPELRNRRQDRVQRGQNRRETYGEDERKRNEKNWDWYKENSRGDRGVVSDDEWTYRPGSRQDDALGDANAQWNRPPSQRQQSGERNTRQQQQRNQNNEDWGKFVSPADAPKKKSGGQDDFFASLMTDLNKDLSTGDSSGPSSPSPASADSSSSGQEEDDFFASLMDEIETQEKKNPTQPSSDSDFFMDDFFTSLDTSSDSTTKTMESETKDSSFNEVDLADSVDIMDKRDEDKSGGFRGTRTPENDEDDFFASLESELGSALDINDKDAILNSDGNDDFFAMLEQEVSLQLDEEESTAEQKNAPKPKPAAESASHAPSSTGEDFSKLTVPKLKEMLKARGLKVSGKKAELIERLRS